MKHDKYCRYPQSGYCDCNTDTPPRISASEIRRLHENATAASWRVGRKVGRTVYGGANQLIGTMDSVYDAELIAALRNHATEIADALDELERLKAELAERTKHVEQGVTLVLNQKQRIAERDNHVLAAMTDEAMAQRIAALEAQLAAVTVERDMALSRETGAKWDRDALRAEVARQERVHAESVDAFRLLENLFIQKKAEVAAKDERIATLEAETVMLWKWFQMLEAAPGEVSETIRERCLSSVYLQPILKTWKDANTALEARNRALVEALREIFGRARNHPDSAWMQEIRQFAESAILANESAKEKP